MPILIYRVLTWQLLLPMLACMAALAPPVILIFLFGQLPVAALGSQLVWSATLGILPTALYLTLPVAAGLGATWAFAHLNADNVLTTLQAMRLSVLTLILPLLLIATPIVAGSYVISSVLAPRSISRIQDIMFLIRQNLSMELFYPQTFYTFGRGQRSLYFENRLGDERIGGVFFHEQRPAGEAQTILAREARIETRGDERHIVFLKGTVQSLDRQGNVARTVVFDELVRPFGGGDSAALPRRNWRGLFEMNTEEFLAARQTVAGHPAKARAWLSEALKRFAVPLLGLGHSLAGLALVLRWGGHGGRRAPDPLWFCAPIVLAHLAILFCAEGTAYYGSWLGWLTGTLIAGECLAAAAVIARFHRRCFA